MDSCVFILSNRVCGVNDGGEGAMDYRQKARGITVAFVEILKKRNKCVETTVQS
jgi:hypothetical protein